MHKQIGCKKCNINYKYKVGCGWSSTYECPKCKHEVLVMHEYDCPINENL
jgi:hypothetical protein